MKTDPVNKTTEEQENYYINGALVSFNLSQVFKMLQQCREIADCCRPAVHLRVLLGFIPYGETLLCKITFQ